MGNNALTQIYFKAKFGNSYYCDDKIISHFREIARTCQDEGFELISDEIT
jgi:hypothetical protein